MRRAASSISFMVALALCVFCAQVMLAPNSALDSQPIAQIASSDALLSSELSAAVESGTMSQVRAEAIQELRDEKGSYEEDSIVLSGTTRERAQHIATELGATLRISSDGSYAQLTLPEGCDITSVYEADEYAEFVAEMQPDWHVGITEIPEGSSDASLESGTEEEDDGSTIISREPSVSFSDPYFSSQSEYNYINSSDILAEPTNSGLVAIIDTGIDTDNPEFSGRIDSLSYNASSDKTVASYGLEVIEDEQGHGTEVAGTLAAAANGKGTVGIASDAQLLIIKADCDESGQFKRTSDLVFGLYYAIERGASVVNMSFGIRSSSDPFADAVALAKDSDVTCVAAAGNESSDDPSYPAANPDVIGVGALAAGSYELAAYSNYGEDNVDLVAPGTVVTTQMGGGVTISSGTSLAAPLVAGAVARYKAIHPHAENDEVSEILAASSTDLGSQGEDWYFGFGALDLDAFINGQQGTISFDMLTDEVSDSSARFIVGKTLQSVPEPEREDVVFDGWYYDEHLQDPYDNLNDILSGDLTVYASWTNEDEGQPFSYAATDGENPANGIAITGYSGKRKYVTIPQTIDTYTVTAIADGAFSGNLRAVSFVLPETVQRIGASAFSNCARLTSIDIPSSVRTICAQAFSGCARLGKVGIQQDGNLESIGSEAFAHCTSLRSFTLPSKVSSFDGSALLGDSKITSVTVASGNHYFKVMGADIVNAAGNTLVYHPAGLTSSYSTPQGIGTIGSCALAYSRADSIKISDGVTKIGDGACQYSSARALSFPSSLSSMGSRVFLGAYNISSADLSATKLTEIPTLAFCECPSLQSVLLPSTLREILSESFAQTGLKAISIPEGVKAIGASAFACSKLESLAMPSTVETLGENAFASCLGLAELEFAQAGSLRELGGNCFANCLSLKAVSLPEGLLAIREQAFFGSGLESVSIPASVSTIEQGAFSGCSSFARISVAAGNTAYKAIDDVLFTADGRTLVLYPAARAGESYAIGSTVSGISGYAFYGAVNLRSISVPASVAEISAYAFSHAYSLKSVSLSEGIATIGINAFEYCSSMESITIPSSIISLGRYAFFGDYALTDVSFAKGTKIARLGFAAFAYCGVSSFEVPASVATMGQYAFAGCTDLQAISFQEGSLLDALPAYAFQGCESLSSIEFGEGSALASLSARCLEGLPALARIDLSGCSELSSLGNYAMSRCFALSEVHLPDSLQSIGRYAFYGCVSLSRLNVPASVSFIGRYAFTTPDAVTSIYFKSASLPADLQDDWNYHIKGYYLGTSGIEVWGDWEYAPLDDGTVALSRYCGTDSIIELGLVNGREVSSIGYDCFKGNETLKSISLPVSIVSICDYSFAGTTALETVTIPAAVTYIGAHAFDASGISSVTFAEGSQLSRIGDAAFANTANMASIKIPAATTKISRCAFMGSALAAISLEPGSQLQSIGSQAFQATAIASIALPDTISEICDYAFYGCESLSSIDFGNPMGLRIQSNAFYGSGLETLTIPAGISYIGEFAFDACAMLEAISVDTGNEYYTSRDGVLYNASCTELIAYPGARSGAVTIPAGVTRIHFGAFERSAVSAVSFETGSSLATIGYRAFYGCENLSSVSVPNGLQSIDSYAFSGCIALTSCDLSNAQSLAAIGRGAFYGCEELSGFSLPDSVQELGDSAFYGCKALKTALPATSEVRVIGDGSFAYSGVTSLNAPASLLTIGREAFRGSALQTLNLENGALLEIGDYAFADCADFMGRKLVIPDTLSLLGKDAFMGMQGKIESLSLTLLQTYEDAHDPEAPIANLFGIYGDAIYTEEYALRELEISFCSADAPGGIPSGLCKGMGNLEKVSINGDASFIGAWAFEYCSSLSSINIPDSCLEIADGAFFSCGSLKLASLPVNCKSIGGYAFKSSGIESLELPRALEEIGLEAFFEAEGFSCDLSSCPLLSSIGDYAFSGTSCSGTIEFPASVKEIGVGLFNGCPDVCAYKVSGDNLTYCTVDGIIYDKAMTQVVSVPDGLTGSIAIPEGITSIPDHAFYDIQGMTEVSLPSTLKSIGAEAFEGSGLVSVSIPDGVETINSGAFSRCASLASISIGSGISTLEDAFSSCTSLTSVEIPGNVETLGLSCFNGCSILREVVLHEGVKTIETSAFENCPELECITIPASLLSISYAFGGCSKLSTIKLAEGNTAYALDASGVLYTSDFSTLIFAPPALSGEYSIVDGCSVVECNAFYRCAIESLIIPDSVRILGGSIGDVSISSCENLANVTVGEGIEVIHSREFHDTPFYDSIPSENGIKYVGNCALCADGSNLSEEVAFKEGTRTIASYCLNFSTGTQNVRTITFPDSVEYIGECSFMGLDKVKTINLGSKVKSIGAYAFSGTGIVSIHLPGSLAYVGSSIFHQCENLAEITLDGSCGFDGTFHSLNGEEHYGLFGYIGRISRLQISDAAFSEKSRGILSTLCVWDGLTFEDDLAVVITKSGRLVTDIWDFSAFDGATFYCSEDPKSTLWPTDWAGGNEVCYQGEWNEATFKVDGLTISSTPLKRGSVLEAPDQDLVKAVVEDPCCFAFTGWDIDGDGLADTLPTTLDAYGSLSASAVYTVHQWNVTSHKDATCTEDGYIRYRCVACKKYCKETESALGHDFCAGEIVEPTETEDGYTVYECSRCDATEQRDWVCATGGLVSDWQTIVAAGCETAGTEARLTPSGHAVETRVLEPIGHDWDEGTVTTQPGCETAGVRTFTCNHDSTHTKTEAERALGHSWGQWVTVIEATYDSPGLRERECTRCGEVDQDELPQLQREDSGVIESVSGSSLVRPGEYLQLSLKATGGYGLSYVWTSSNESVATVDSQGRVQGIADGTAIIMVSASDGLASTFNLTVRHECVAGEAVTENVVSATADEPESYDEVHYCVICNAELSRVQKVVEKTGMRAEQSQFTGFDAWVLRFFPGDGNEGDSAMYNGEAMAWDAIHSSWVILVQGRQSSLSSEFKQIAGGTRLSLYQEDYLRGDLNSSGEVNVVDAQIAFDLCCGVYPLRGMWQTMLLADVNGDGYLDAADAFAIQRASFYGWSGE